MRINLNWMLKEGEVFYDEQGKGWKRINIHKWCRPILRTLNRITNYKIKKFNKKYSINLSLSTIDINTFEPKIIKAEIDIEEETGTFTWHSSI